MRSHGTVRPMIGVHKLNNFIGSWVGEECLRPTAWTESGVAEGTFVIAEAPLGGVLIDYTETRDGQIVLRGHGVLAEQGWWWFDSFGYVPTTPGAASWHDNSLVLERSSERGRTTMRLWIEDDALHQEIETAVPAAAEFAPMLFGRYERAPATASTPRA